MFICEDRQKNLMKTFQILWSGLKSVVQAAKGIGNSKAQEVDSQEQAKSLASE